MTAPEDSCSFCQQPQSKVEKLFQAETGARICNRCVAVCHGVLVREGVGMDKPPAPPSEPSE